MFERLQMITRKRDQRGFLPGGIVAVSFSLLMVLTAPTKAEFARGDRLDFETSTLIVNTFNQGMGAFEKRDWAMAIAEMEKVISICESYPDRKAIEPQMERLGPVYFTVGAAAFNLPDYPKAVAAFERFVTQFPKSDKVPHARLAIARAS